MLPDDRLSSARVVIVYVLRMIKGYGRQRVDLVKEQVFVL